MKKILLLLLLSLTVMGCATVNNEMQSWVGHPKSELIAQWGYPTRTGSDGKGGEILVWDIIETTTHPGYSTTYSTGNAYTYGNNAYGYGNSRTTYVPPRTETYTKTRTFYVNQGGYVYGWSWKGL